MEKLLKMKDLIIKLKQIKEENKLSVDKIKRMIQEDGDYLAKSTIARVFAEGAENESFRYEETIRPIANALLKIERMDENDSLAVQAIKDVVKVKMEMIEDLERQLEQKDLKNHEKMDKLRKEQQRKIDFLIKQIELKDDRITTLLRQNEDLTNHFINCPYRNNCYDKS